MGKGRLRWLLCLSLGGFAAEGWAQRPVIPLGEGPWEFATFEQDLRIRVSVVTRGLVHPWGLAFLPGSATSADPMGDALVTENGGRVRLLRAGKLLPEPVADLSGLALEQLFDVVTHPDYPDNALVYLSYMKSAPRPDGGEGYWATHAVARGRFDGSRLVDLEDLFVADAWNPNRGGHAVPLAFGSDGSLYLPSSHRLEPDLPQDLGSHIGKILRLNDDGSVPPDNPFLEQEGARPEIFSYGHRTIMGLEVHPVSGDIWEAENGPQGGDEVNVLKPGRNYGWPLVTYGREYDGSRATLLRREGMEPPELFWVPSITVSSLEFYTGERLPEWRNNLFVGAMTTGRVPGTGHLQRIVFNENGEVRRERLLGELRQRIRLVEQGPDGLLYALTDEDDGVLLRIEPASPALTSLAPASSAGKRGRE